MIHWIQLVLGQTLTAAIVIGAVSVSPKNAISGTNTRIVGR
jgi:hypothetical protein